MSRICIIKYFKLPQGEDKIVAVFYKTFFTNLFRIYTKSFNFFNQYVHKGNGRNISLRYIGSAAQV